MRRVRFFRWDVAFFLLVFLLKNILIVTAQNVYFVATDGIDNNPGTLDKPFATWQKGFSAVKAGDTLYIRGGVYYPVGIDNGGGNYYGVIASQKNGTAGNMINVWAYPGETPIFDCSNITQSNAIYIGGISLWDCDYWHMKGLTVRNTKQQATCLYAHGFAFADVRHCIFENLVAHDIQNSGFVLVGGINGTSTDNYVTNCDAYNCYDPLTSPAGGDGDGFTIGNCPNTGSTTIRGCRAWNNSDDGFDFWFGEGVIRVDSCWSFNNGNHLGDGNGFKLGRTDNETNAIVGRYISNCIAAGNHSKSGGSGFDQNSGKVLMNLDKNFAYKNSGWGFLFGDPNVPDILRKNTAYLNTRAAYWGLSNIITDSNSWNVETMITSDDFFSLDTMQLYRKRKSDGSLPEIDFGKPKPNSGLVKAGVSVFKYVTHITVTGAGDATTIKAINSTLQLNTSVLPTDATNKTFTWSVQNSTGKATISSTGLVTAVAAGTVTAKATANDGSGVSGTLAITISNQTVLVTGITVTGAGSATTITTDGGTLQLNTAMSPATATNKTVTWSMNNGTGQATISSTGLVTAVANGTVTAKATANDGSGVSGTLVITISNQTLLVTGITVTGENGASIIAALGSTLQLSAAVLPANATNKTFTWSIADGTGLATISATGLVTAVGNGTVTSKATANDGSGVSGLLVITISTQMIPVTGITVTGANGLTTINVNEGTLQLNTVVLPADATNTNYTWSIINNSGQAGISATGLVTAIDNGTITAKATANDGSGISGTLNITISNQMIPITTVYIDPGNTNDLLANGSFDHPLDSWDDVTWKEGCTYLQKRGTETTTNKILIGASKVALGAYGEGESPVISSQTNTYLISGFEKSGIKISDLNLQASNAVSCIYFLGNSGDSIVIEHCELKANANAIKVVDGSTLVTKYNTITSNHEGIYSTAVSNEIYYNIFKSCNTAVNVVSNSSKANIYNNVFFDNEKSLSMSYAELTLYNNIFYMTTPGQMAISLGTGNIESDHNIFYPEQAGFITIANTQFNNLDELQKSLKIDMNSFNADPLFVDIYNENFSLASGSPAINAGVDLQLGIDYEGSTVPLAGGTDIGINEFTGPIIPSKKPNEKSVMTIYPNPSSGQISILAEIKQDMLPDDPGFSQPEIRVMDISGHTVFSELLENQNTSTIQDDIDLSGISNGLYFVVLHIADEFIQEKLIITK